jgi:hypothetical protein
MNTTSDRTPLQDPLMNQLRSTLDAVEAEQAAAPSPTPPWERIQAGMGRARRYRRRVRVARVCAGLLAMSTAGAAVVTGVVPYPSFAPTVAIPGTAGKSALDDGHIRGSLAGDADWLRALREQIAHGEIAHESDGQFWAPPAAKNLSVIYAGDVGAYRVALVEGDWHWGPIASRQQVWFEGPAGSSAAQMEKGGNKEPADLAVSVLSPSNFGKPIGDSSAVVVISATAIPVRLEESPSIDARGKVVRRSKALSRTDGVYTAVVTSAGPSYLSVNASGSYPSQTIGGNREQQPEVPAQRPARGGAIQSAESLQSLAALTWGMTRQPMGDGADFRLLAAESPARPEVEGPVTAVVGLVTLPSGARVLSVGEIHHPDGGLPDWVNACRLLPAGDDDADLSIAWHRPGASTNGTDGQVVSTKPGWTAAMGPVGTVRVQWIHRDGEITSQDTSNTITGTDRDDVTSVRFLDKYGAVLGTTAVLAAIDQGGFLPEVDPEKAAAAK